ncbi:glycerophosphodiester phosphodiesterase [Pedobacter sp. BS3]|uniref:glycerophosphodiester phosphodiesterase family protein n=1 Tax=Pedobacter sp. BS3 TaxID=2567937 RepID=UPI0011EDFBCC|nr:glycerophosphodiester phosphodiesterase family protein [Pedobacter sp. BS3]TZF80719.1 glycerophosphodiester phosphodiesterase [Pedobacter sp. BS3]
MKRHYNKLAVLLMIPVFATAQAQQKFDPQAHRGGRGLMPENSVAAMKNALDLGATLELDLSYTKDGKVIVSHDNYISSVFALDPNGNPIPKADEKKYRLYNLTYDEIQKFDTGSKPHPEFPGQKKMHTVIPLFSDLLDSVEAYAKSKHLKPPGYNIEAKLAVPENTDKTAFREEFIKKIMAIIHDKKIQKRMMLQSFDIGMLEIVHRDYKVKISYLVGKGDLETNLKKLTFVPDIYSPYYPLVTSELVQQCHQKGMKVIPWTVNTKEEIETLKAMGVDGIISDYPDLF